MHTRVQPASGIVLHGPPGSGKTMLVNAIAQEIGVPLIYLRTPWIMSGMYGEPEKKLKETFEEAHEKAPCLIFMDEIDAIISDKESTKHGMSRRIVAQMLACIDNLSLRKTGGKPVIIIGATQQPDSLDPALRTARRFDREICIKMPNEVGREKYCPNLPLMLIS